jgi:hypothetical protein
VTHPPVVLPPLDEFSAALLDCIEEYRKGAMNRVHGPRHTRTGYRREYICITDIHAMLAKRGIKRSKTTVSRHVKDFIERERRSFEIGVWVDEMDATLEAFRELTDRMNPEWNKPQLDVIERALSIVRQVIQPWAIERARSADDNETLARLVKYSSEYFGPASREDKGERTPPKLGIVN